MGEIRGLTVRQPWAWAIVHGGKDVENRTRNLAGSYRGPLAIHVATGRSLMAHFHDVQRIRPDLDRDALPWSSLETGQPPNAGHVIGVVDLVDVHDAAPPEVEWCGCSQWAERFYVHHIVLANPRPLATPIRWRGALNLWRVPAELEARIRDQGVL